MLEPQAPDSLARWGLMNSVFETGFGGGVGEYLSEPIARRMMADNPELRKQFEAKLAADPQFAADPRARLQWWFQQSKYEAGDTGPLPHRPGVGEELVALTLLLFVANLLRKVTLVADLLDLVDLRFQPVDVLLFVFEQAFEEFARRVVALFAGDADGVVVERHGADLQLEIALQLFLDVLADGELHRIGQIGRGIEEEDALDQDFGVLHLVDGLLLDEIAQPVVKCQFSHISACRKYWLIAVNSSLRASLRAAMTFGLPFIYAE